MLYNELQKRRSIILHQDTKFKYTLFEATKEETDELFQEMAKYSEDKGYDSDKFDFLAIVDFAGEVNEVNHYHVKELIPVIKTHKATSEKTGKEIIVNETKCYQAPTGSINNNIILHEDKVSSFKCACQAIKTTSFIVLKEPKYIQGIDPYEKTKERKEDNTKTEELP